MARGDPPISLEALVPYYSGAYTASVALKGRLARHYAGPEGRALLQEISHYQQVLAEFRQAIQQTVERKRGG